MQLQTIEITNEANVGQDADDPSYDLRVMRHTIVMPQGLMYYQDEYIRNYGQGKISSERTGWTPIDMPASPDEPVGTFEYAGLFGAIMKSGKTYLYAAKVPDKDDEDGKIAYDIFVRQHRIHEWPHEWVPISDPLPQTIANLARRV